ncbi:MAG: hypothetical protein ACI9YL_002123, partial [Luteibaculaceae bacterium]
MNALKKEWVSTCGNGKVFYICSRFRTIKHATTARLRE